jgi:hypothetical protein
MPIANIFLAPTSPADLRDDGRLVRQWSEVSGISAEHMTLNIMRMAAQQGAAYQIMAFLYLPTLWQPEHRDALQLGLARALSDGFVVDPDSIQIITSLVDSGCTVTGGRIETW